MNSKQQLAANQAIAAFMGLCVHKLKEVEAEGDNGTYFYHICTKCDTPQPNKTQRPDYCSPDSPRRLLEEVEAKVNKTFWKEPQKLAEALDDEVNNMYQLLFATTEQRVWAIIEVLGCRTKIEALADKGE